jgi:hypothetical protein
MCFRRDFKDLPAYDLPILINHKSGRNISAGNIHGSSTGPVIRIGFCGPGQIWPDTCDVPTFHQHVLRIGIMKYNGDKS